MKKTFLLVLPVVVIAISFYLLYSMLAQVEDQTLEQSIEIEQVYAHQAAEGIESFFEFYKNSCKHLSESYPIRNFPTIENNFPGKMVMKNFYSNHQSKILGITRIDKKGNVVYTYPERNDLIGTNVSFQEHNSLIINQQIPVVSDVFKTIQGSWAVALAYPIFKENGEYNGCLSMLFAFQEIAKKFVGNIKVGSGGYAFLLSQKGIELYCGDDEHIGKSIFETSGKFPSIIELSKQMLKGKKGTGTYIFSQTGDNKVEKLVTYYPIKLENTFWSIAISIPKNEVIANTSNLRFNLFTTLFVTAIAMFIILFIYYKNYKTNQKNIVENEIKYRTIAEQTGQLIYEYDIIEKTLKLSGNVKLITGYKLEEFNYKPASIWNNIVHPIDKENVVETFMNSIELKKNFHSVYQIVKKNNEAIYIEDNAIYTESFDKKPKMLGTIKDITHRIEAEKELIAHRNELEQLVTRRTRELKMANDELLIDIKKRKATELELLEAKNKAEKSDLLKSEFLAQISHEIRTPINVILNYSSLIRYEFEDKLPTELEGSFDSINNAAIRLLRTVDLIINMSEIETDNYEPSTEYLNLYEDIIHPLILEFSLIANGKGIELIVNNDAYKNELIFVDRYTVTRIFENLIDNAIKYTEKGQVEIKIYNDKQYYMAEINDTGIGIAEEYLPYLFSKFSQEEQGYTRRFEGNGLGLALVKEYCRINNANIDVESEKGVGTSFKLTFHI